MLALLALALVSHATSPRALRAATARRRATVRRGGADDAQSEMITRLRTGEGFVAALDQSGGSTPSALKNYGVTPDAWSSDAEMFDLVHEMRERIAASGALDGQCLAAILFEATMDRTFEGQSVPAYLWKKRIVPLLKCDKGLAPEADGCQLMNDMPELERTLARAKALGVAGTKMRSRIAAANAKGVEAVVQQQFDVAKRIIGCGLVPIIEPEVDVNIPDKGAAEEMLVNALHAQLAALEPGQLVMLKLTLPDVDDLYASCVAHPNVVRVLALSGGYSRGESCARLKRQSGIIASFSRALTEGLRRDMPDVTFHAALTAAAAEIFDASRHKVTEEDGAEPAMYADVAKHLGKGE